MFSKLNFIIPLLNTDKVLKICNTYGQVVLMIKEPACTLKVNDVNVIVKQNAEGSLLTLNFGSIQEAQDAHILLRNALYQLAINIGQVPGPGPGPSPSTIGEYFNLGDWQDSIKTFISSIPGSPIDSDRYIALTSITNVISYNYKTDVTSIITVPANSILHYWDRTVHGTINSGWIIITPTIGMYTNIDSVFNKIIKWDGTEWIDLNWIPSDDFKYTHPVNTTVDGQYSGISSLTDIPAGNVTVDILVNGLQVIVGNGCTATTFISPTWEALFAKSYSIVSNTSTTVTIAGVNYFGNSDCIIVTDNGIIKCFDILNITGNILTINGTFTGTGTVTTIMQPKKWGNIKQGDVFLWFGSYANYQLDTTDIIALKYLTHN